MSAIKGPAIFLAQFLANEAPFNKLDTIAAWAAENGYKGIQVPTSDDNIFNLKLAAESQDYCDEVAGICREAGVEITELSTHLQGQLVAVHPAYDELFDNFAPSHLHGKPQQRTEWAIDQLKCAAIASKRLGLTAHATFSGALLWHLVYPWPQRPAGLVEQGFAELAKRWKPILDVFDEQGVDVCYEIHPGEDLHDGATFERFLKAVDNHPRANILFDPSHFVLQQLDYLDFIDRYHDRIKMFHVKDAEFNATGRSGVYGGYEDWVDRPGRFRSLGDGQVDFNGIFSKLTQYGFDGWAVLEWECCLKDSAQGAAEGAPFIQRHIIERAKHAFDDFAGAQASEERNRRILGLTD
ncbi:sugar phosphate isomerase/epimerase family protein [Alteromonas gilva]|uniref:Sugar phosphate isomerase/epimerase n=1 Tax=Alteromonas gilva TaxID=2987522 RepID=A0ABT5KYG2_9ALTE|nr:sugar phosphate isomerase/epimerase [Alteromonas gilva]MDC8829818.1 sugar phosphate isomerase/epimerase [Alteromonas gilva]